ncbi:MAG: argininosuccinate synthase, partial [Actinobacteria bacterium]|nr:argininosuccinate synthase [Actinomycetota bacterium]
MPKNAPDKEEYINLKFKKGIPVALNKEKLSLAELIVK